MLGTLINIGSEGNVTSIGENVMDFSSFFFVLLIWLFTEIMTSYTDNLLDFISHIKQPQVANNKANLHQQLDDTSWQNNSQAKILQHVPSWYGLQKTSKQCPEVRIQNTDASNQNIKGPNQHSKFQSTPTNHSQMLKPSL